MACRSSSPGSEYYTPSPSSPSSSTSTPTSSVTPTRRLPRLSFPPQTRPIPLGRDTFSALRLEVQVNPVLSLPWPATTQAVELVFFNSSPLDPGLPVSVHFGPGNRVAVKQRLQEDLVPTPPNYIGEGTGSVRLYPCNVLEEGGEGWNDYEQQQMRNTKQRVGTAVAVTVKLWTVALLMLFEAILLFSLRGYHHQPTCSSSQTTTTTTTASSKRPRPVFLEPLPIITDLLSLSTSYASIPPQVIPLLLGGNSSSGNGNPPALIPALGRAQHAGESIVEILHQWHGFCRRTDEGQLDAAMVWQRWTDATRLLLDASHLVDPVVSGMEFWLMPVMTMLEAVSDAVRDVVISEAPQHGLPLLTSDDSGSDLGITEILAANRTPGKILEVLAQHVGGEHVDSVLDRNRRYADQLRKLARAFELAMPLLLGLYDEFEHVFVRGVNETEAAARWKAVLARRTIKRHRWADGEYYHVDTKKGAWQAVQKALGLDESVASPYPTAKTEAGIFLGTINALRTAGDELPRLVAEHANLTAQIESLILRVDRLRQGDGWILSRPDEEMDVHFYMPPLSPLLPEVQLTLHKARQLRRGLWATVKELEERNRREWAVELAQREETSRREMERWESETRERDRRLGIIVKKDGEEDDTENDQQRWERLRQALRLGIMDMYPDVEAGSTTTTTTMMTTTGGLGP